MVADRWTTALLISVAFLFIALVEGELEMVESAELWLVTTVVCAAGFSGVSSSVPGAGGSSLPSSSISTSWISPSSTGGGGGGGGGGGDSGGGGGGGGTSRGSGGCSTGTSD